MGDNCVLSVVFQFELRAQKILDQPQIPGVHPDSAARARAVVSRPDRHDARAQTVRGTCAKQVSDFQGTKEFGMWSSTTLHSASSRGCVIAWHFVGVYWVASQ